MVPFAIVFFGMWVSPRISNVLEARLRAQNSADEESPKDGGISKDDTQSNQTSISEPLLQ